MRAICATMCSISVTEIDFLRGVSESLDLIRRLAPASSIISMALSGKNRSVIYREESSAAAFNALLLYLTS